MRQGWKTLLGGLAAIAIAITGSASPAAAAFPERPITLVVPWAAGGGTDAVARFVAAMLEKDFGQPINVVNRTGGSGVIGHQAIATAKPDGYTIGLITLEINMMHWVGLTDLDHTGFTPLALMNTDPAAIHVKTDSKYKTIKELLDDIKANPGKFKASGTGQGGSWHLALGGLLKANGIDPKTVGWVPATGAATALTDLAGGGVDFVSCSLPEAESLTKAGRVRTLVYMGSERSKVAPDIPTVKEATGADWTMVLWRAMAAPKGLPADIAAKYEAAFKKVYDSKEYQDFMANRGFGTAWGGSAELGAFLAKNNKEMGESLKDLGLAKK